MHCLPPVLFPPFDGLVSKCVSGSLVGRLIPSTTQVLQKTGWLVDSTQYNKDIIYEPRYQDLLTYEFGEI
jgi:hypothetical protein